MTTPHEIAMGLTEAQKRAVLWLPEDGSPREHVKGSPPEVSFYALKEKVIGNPRLRAATIFKLVERVNGYQPINGKWPRAQYRLTPLGLQVRSILKEQGK